MPPEIVQRWNTEIVSVLKLPETRERLASQGVDAQPSTADAFARLLVTDLERWAEVVKRAGVKPE